MNIWRCANIIDSEKVGEGSQVKVLQFRTFFLKGNFILFYFVFKKVMVNKKEKLYLTQSTPKKVNL